MRVLVCLVMFTLGVFLANAVLAASLYEEARHVCGEQKEGYVIFTYNKKQDITVTKADGSVDWSRAAFMDVVEQNDTMFVIRCTSDDSPLGAVPQIYAFSSVDDIDRVIEMEFLANSGAHERGRYTYVFHGIANFAKEVFVVFGLKTDARLILLELYPSIPQHERTISTLPYHVADKGEQMLNIYPEAFSREADKAYEQYFQFFYNYLQTQCVSALEKKHSALCESADTYDFGIGLLGSPAKFFLYLQVHRKSHLPLRLHVVP